jgi:hypothetical protein
MATTSYSTETLEGGDRYSVLPKLRGDLVCLGERERERERERAIVRAIV